MNLLKNLPRWFRFNLMYLGKPPWDTGVSPPELLDFIQRTRPGRAIDLGCGTGTNLVTLAKAGWQVTGVDFVLKAVTQARRRLAGAGLSGDVRSGDVSRLDTVRGSYDLVLDIGCYHSLAEPAQEQYRRNLPLILARSGHYLLYAHWRSVGSGALIGINDQDLDALRAKLVLEDRQDSQDRRGRSAVWMRFRAPDG